MTVKIGYARVSAIDQNLDRQIAALRAEGCEKIFAEKASGGSLLGRPQLEKAIQALGTGYILVVAEWDRATRSMLDGITIMQRLANRSCFIKVLDKPHLDLTTPMGRGFLALLSAVAEDERLRIKERSAQGRDHARKAGKHLGRPPRLSLHQQARAHQRVTAGESTRTIAKEWGVAHTTIARACRVQEAKLEKMGKGSVQAIEVILPKPKNADICP